ncbi:RING finger protein mug140 [Taphrina deformans PYCC 5710]|uniref:RING finger protein mug140 n=1 Tax=Taphrina deformans (strain PYCC 5710 / ATCC 11124 / CBS 356.35 / IMI 108563 / JCM 9778 / NBRC 8474) TaxID=1097556 RepID=R4XFD6_TAPDE|nr:RING finger protein mug140 [Taphrina deformans PYCC 5710]|eukprot:CCG82062.1 RING finger protein mug140 [Taphrina deformans PYCC 5710]
MHRSNNPSNTNASDDAGTESAAWRQRRRDWLLETAQRRTRQRETRSGMTGETQTRSQAGSVPGIVGLVPEMIGSGVARFRAFIHGPNGGGPVRSAMGLPENFLPGSNISLVPHMNHFHAPDLNYAIYNEMFSGLQIPQPSALPKYEAPAPLKDPFTRTFTEQDMLICPGCRTELGGTGDEIRRKVWVSKCSHVYCGQCGSDIKKSAKKQGAICVAPDCTKKITKTKIFEAYI